MQPPSYQVVQLNSLDALPCPCGFSRRAFASGSGIQSPASVHLVEIQADARTHYHKGMTEYYVVLEGEGLIELDGTGHQLKPLTAVMIPPLCRHRAVGRLRVLNFVTPAFDPQDEWFD